MKILIADDHALFRDELSHHLEEIDPNVTLWQAASFSQVLKILEQEQEPDLILLDPEMPETCWDEGIRTLRRQRPDLNIAVVSASEDIRDIRKILATGIRGYIPKRSDPKVMKNALKLILDGGMYLPPALLDHSAEETMPLPRKLSGKTLTNRQSQVLDLIAQGKSNKQIAYEMGVSEATVKLHINALLRSLRVNNRTQAVVTAQKMGLI